jgi:hypothetical protein
MKTKFLFPFVLGLLALSVPARADSAASASALIDNSNALTPYVSDAQSIASLPDFPAGDFSDTLPMFTLQLSRSNLMMGIAFLAEKTVVGSSSVDGARVLLTFKAAHP